jgi:hypothetical protein
MEKCSIYCVNTEKDAVADILSKSDKRLKVVIEGTDLTIILQRNDVRSPYIGYEQGLEFESFGDMDE